jgi:pimeloyl-ACP methyl ester carboxylesterase
MGGIACGAGGEHSVLVAAAVAGTLDGWGWRLHCQCVMSSRAKLIVSWVLPRCWRWGMAALAVMALAGGIAAASSPAWLPGAIAASRNGHRAIQLADDASDADLERRGVDRHVRIEVGPPAASLSVWIIEPRADDGQRDRSARGTVLVLHGIHGEKSAMLSVGRRLAAAGYRAVLADLRGHGRSTGEWLTYGVVESRDLSQVLHQLEREGLLSGPLGVYGASYGGATAIMLAGEDPRVRAVVAVAPYASMQEEVFDYIRSYRLVPAWLISDATIRRAVERAGELGRFEPQAASPLTAMSRTQARVLLIHGAADRKIPARHSQSLHAVAPGQSELLLMRRKGHVLIFQDYSGEVTARALEWFDRWML